MHRINRVQTRRRKRNEPGSLNQQRVGILAAGSGVRKNVFLLHEFLKAAFIRVEGFCKRYVKIFEATTSKCLIFSRTRQGDLRPYSVQGKV
jgi:hypothetical protein